MAGLLVYLPGYDGESCGELTARGLGDLLDPSIDAIFTPAAKGPDGGSGKLVTFYPGDSPREVNLDTQLWLEAPPAGELAKGRYWLGCVKAAKPTAGDLQRGMLIDGEPVTLGDGNQWIVPLFERAPKRLTRDPGTGRVIRVTKDEHVRWTEWSNEVLDLIMSNDYASLAKSGCVVHIPGGMEYAALALSKNYRVNFDVIDLLALLDDNQASELILAATGVLLRARLVSQKKSTANSFQSAGAS